MYESKSFLYEMCETSITRKVNIIFFTTFAPFQPKIIFEEEQIIDCCVIIHYGLPKLVTDTTRGKICGLV